MGIRFFLSFALLSAGLPALAAEGCAGGARLFSQLTSPRLSLNAANLNATLSHLLAEAGLRGAEDASLLRMALENALQHGVEDMYAPTAAAVRVKVTHAPGAVEIEITNPLFKKFPPRLEREFAPGESVALSSEERPFPRGFGVGLPQMFRSFAQFPPGAKMGWETTEKEVTFRLRVPQAQPTGNGSR
jgi:hypothetical protein